MRKRVIAVVVLAVLLTAAAVVIGPVVWMICHMPHGGCSIW